MHFLKIAAPFMALASSASAGLLRRSMSSEAMVANINNITQQSSNLMPVVMNIQAPVEVLGDSLRKRQTNPFEPVINGFRDIITTAQDDITAMSGTPAYSDSEAQPVCDAFTDFVKVHQELLKIVIGKSGLLESVFLGPVASVLRTLEDAVDTLAFGIIDAVPVCADSATSQKSNLDDTLGKAICAYTPGGTLGLNLFC
ncbi:hypothetical protein MBLNU459_g4933t1 [Dothideomycetes sp. NU459]